MEHPTNVNMNIIDSQTFGKTAYPSTDLVQIKADKNEIQRRITAFITRKRKETDEMNLQEFCNLPCAEMASEFSCARVDSVVIQRAGSRGHVKVSKVVNEWGPQTMPTKLRKLSTQAADEVKQEGAQSQLPGAIEERLSSMETHLNIKAGNYVRKNIYERLKNLEDRILFLESLSPDYFDESRPPTFFQSPQKDKRHLHQSSSKSDLSMDEIDARMNALKDGLLRRSNDQGYD